MGHFFEQFVPAGIEPAIFWLGVLTVTMFLAGVVLMVVGRRDEPEQTTLPPLEHPPPRGPRVVPGPAIQRHWENYLRAYHARGGLGSPLVQLPDESSRDAFLRDTPQAAPSGPSLASAELAFQEQAPPLPPHPAGSVPLAFQPGGPPWPASAPLLAPGFDEEAKASPAAEEPAAGDEEGEADGWASSRPWVILPSRFPVAPPPRGVPLPRPGRRRSDLRP